MMTEFNPPCSWNTSISALLPAETSALTQPGPQNASLSSHEDEERSESWSWNLVMMVLGGLKSDRDRTMFYIQRCRGICAPANNTYEGSHVHFQALQLPYILSA